MCCTVDLHEHAHTATRHCAINNSTRTCIDSPRGACRYVLDHHLPSLQRYRISSDPDMRHWKVEGGHWCALLTGLEVSL